MRTTIVGQSLKLPTGAAAAVAVAALAWATPVAAQTQDPDPRPPVVVEQDAVRVQHPTDPPYGIVREGAWTVTPMLGFGFGGNLENSPLNLGVGAAYNWTSRVSFEGELGFARSADQGIVNRFSSTVVTGNVNALYHFATENTAPYVTVGLGFGHSDADIDTLGLTALDTNNTSLMVNFGGGVKTRLGENVNLRLGIRYFNGADLVPDFWRPYAGLTFILGPR